MQMSEQQFKRWMIAKTRQYAWAIFKLDPNYVKITFKHNFNAERPVLRYSHGYCITYTKHICYRTDYVTNGWDCDLNALEKLVIHEVCHLQYNGHPNEFYKLYQKWSDDNVIQRYLNREFEYTQNGRGYISGVAGLPFVK